MSKSDQKKRPPNQRFKRLKQWSQNKTCEVKLIPVPWHALHMWRVVLSFCRGSSQRPGTPQHWGIIGHSMDPKRLILDLAVEVPNLVRADSVKRYTVSKGILWLCKPKTNHGNQDLIVEQNEGKPEASTHDSMCCPASEGLIIFCTTDGKPASILSCCSGPQSQGLPTCDVLMLCLDGRGGEVCEVVYGWRMMIHFKILLCSYTPELPAF